MIVERTFARPPTEWTIRFEPKSTSESSVSGVFCCVALNHARQAVFSIIDEPEIHVDKAWIHADVGVEVEISCIVHAEPRAEVSNDQQ